HLSGMSPGSVAGQARRREVAALLLAMLTGGWVAGAQAGEPAVVGAPPAPLTLILKGDREYLDPPAIRTAVESEIGRPVVVGDAPLGDSVLTVTLAFERGELAVSYRDARRGTIARVVTAPATEGELLRNVAWLAGNLVRD